MPPTSDGLSPKEVEAYLHRLDLAPAAVGEPDFSTLARLQGAHILSVPFETLSITGDPYGERAGEGVVLSGSHLYEKIVERERGGYCFELTDPCIGR
jgi:N-hydroxyarylamine O-acetyltransferase